PLLATVPESAFTVAEPASNVTEAFHTLRTGLTYFNVTQPVGSVLVSSAIKGEGKTTVAVGLSRAMATAGKDVVLVEADFRRPAIASRLGLDSNHGLGDVLTGQHRLEDVLQEVDSPDGRLRVILSGPPPP